VRKIIVAVCGVNEIPRKSLCKFVNDCGKQPRERGKEGKVKSLKFQKERKEFYTLGSENAEDTKKRELII
jgi:hypothetical protein